jgi:hypothetical protein
MDQRRLLMCAPSFSAWLTASTSAQFPTLRRLRDACGSSTVVPSDLNRKGFLGAPESPTPAFRQ